MKKQTKKMTSISVETNFYKKVSDYCRVKGLRIYAWAQKALESAINKGE